MEKHLVDFEKMDWVDVGEGIRYKKFESNGKILRLMDLLDTYYELDWCKHGHIGMIIEGEFQVEFETHMESFIAGDTVFIKGGEEHKHKASVPKGKRLKMLSFEID